MFENFNGWDYTDKNNIHNTNKNDYYLYTGKIINKNISKAHEITS